MNPQLELMAEALLARDALRLRGLVLDRTRARNAIAALDDPPPGGRLDGDPGESSDRVLIAAAALAELFAEREGRPSPDWARAAGALPEPFFAVAAAERMKSVRELCLRESPEPLRRHGILAPPGFLEEA